MEISENFLLIGALENVLGKSYKRAKGNRIFHCPWCHHRKPKLEINVNVGSPHFGHWQCWVCGQKGRTIKSLLRHLQLSPEETKNILQYVRAEDTGKPIETSVRIVRLPEEYVALSVASKTSVYANRVRNYLYSRGLTDNDFVKYEIGYCMKGKYADHVIIPSYGSNNILNYFVARDLNPNAFAKYTNPECSKDCIIFENLVNWNEPIILCEGVFDAFAIRRNAVPLLGKTISPTLMKKIITSSCPDLYIVLDRDAVKQALKHCETFLNMGKRVFFVEPREKDPSDEGFRRFTEQIQTAEELTLRTLLEYKLKF